MGYEFWLLKEKEQLCSVNKGKMYAVCRKEDFLICVDVCKCLFSVDVWIGVLWIRVSNTTSGERLVLLHPCLKTHRQIDMNHVAFH